MDCLVLKGVSPKGGIPSKQAYSNEEKGVCDILLNIQIVILL